LTDLSFQTGRIDAATVGKPIQFIILARLQHRYRRWRTSTHFIYSVWYLWIQDNPTGVHASGSTGCGFYNARFGVSRLEKWHCFLLYRAAEMQLISAFLPKNIPVHYYSNDLYSHVNMPYYCVIFFYSYRYLLVTRID
jgi:hypothetical protein